MQATKTQPYKTIEATLRQPLTKTKEAKSEAVVQAAKQVADNAAARSAERAQRATTNAQGETIGSRLNVTA
jgi:hypothetical protein